MNFADPELWQWLVGVGTLLILAEALVPGFFVMPVGLGLVLTGVVAYFTTNPIVIIVALAVFEVVSLLVLRKVLKTMMGDNKVLSNAEGMIGKEAVVIEAIEPNGTGYVKLYGDQWMARSPSTQTLTVGQRVTIIKLDGNKVWVEPVQQ